MLQLWVYRSSCGCISCNPRQIWMYWCVIRPYGKFFVLQGGSETPIKVTPFESMAFPEIPARWDMLVKSTSARIAILTTRKITISKNLLLGVGGWIQQICDRFQEGPSSPAHRNNNIDTPKNHYIWSREKRPGGDIFPNHYSKVHHSHIYICIYMGVSKNWGTPKWMVYKGNPY